MRKKGCRCCAALLRAGPDFFTATPCSNNPLEMPALHLATPLLAMCCLRQTAAAPTAPAAPMMKPLLFMEARDILDKFGKLQMVANEVQRMPGLNAPRGLNYTGGDTVTAAFPLLDGPGAEIFVAVGRPGEPFAGAGRVDSSADSTAPAPPCICSNTCPQSCNPDQGVQLQRFTTKDFKTWSEPVTVAYFPNGSGDDDDADTDAGSEAREQHPMDGTVWTLKSMDRNEVGQYLLAGSYGSAVHFFMSDTPPTKPKSFYPLNSERSIKKSNFKDHDDVNLFWHQPVRFTLIFDYFSTDFDLFCCTRPRPGWICRSCTRISPR